MAKRMVLIPAFNEECKIADVIGRVRTIVPGFHIVVINDGSSDATAKRACEAGAVVVSHPVNMGYGVAIQTGYKYALRNNFDFLVQIDGDGQHDPVFIPKLLEPVESGDVDFAIGSRFLSAKSYVPSMPRRIGMLLFKKIVSLIVGQEVTDCTSGYQAFNRQVLRFFVSDLFPCDYPDADTLISLHLAGLKIKEVPVRMYENVEGKSMHSGIKPIYYVIKMFLSIGVTLLRSHKLYRGEFE